MNRIALKKSIFISSLPEAVWPYLVDKDKLGEWYHPAENDLTKGENYALLVQDKDGSRRKQVWGTVLDLAPEQKLVTTFCIEAFGPHSTTVTWELHEIAGGTMLFLTHEGIPEAAGDNAYTLVSALDKGWDIHLGDLRECHS